MLVQDRKAFGIGLMMAISFLLVFFLMFSPSFDGKNAFEAADDLFNSIAKGSTYYIPGLREKLQTWRSVTIDVNLPIEGDRVDARNVLVANGLEAVDSGSGLEWKGTLGLLLEAALDDADKLFHNSSEEIGPKYDMSEQQVLYVWWTILGALERALTRQERFDAAAFVSEVNARAVEVAYNFYGVDSEEAASKAPILSFSLVFYVFYTLWWGYAIYFLAQGLGLQLRKGAKKEV